MSTPNIAIIGQVEYKNLEYEYFQKVLFDGCLLVGGSLGQLPGGITATTVSHNGKLYAQAISNGSILIYDTEQFNLIRIFEGNKSNVFYHLEFSSDNTSQLMALSEGGILSTFLLKGLMPPSSMKSQYIDKKKIVMVEDKPMLLIPYYNVNYGHFQTNDAPLDSQLYQITSATFHPSISAIAFQNSVTIGS